MIAYFLLRCRVRPPICEAFAADAFKQRFRVGLIIESELGAMVIAEVEFSRVALKMLRAAMLIHAIHAALEDAEKSFNRVSVHVATYVSFALWFTVSCVADIAQGFDTGRAICHKMRVFRHLGLEGFQLERSGCNVVDVKGADMSIALNKGKHSFFVGMATAFLVPGLRPIKVSSASIVPLPTTKQTSAVRLHRFSQTVCHEPCGFVGHAKHALDLFTADTLFARCHQRCCEQPFIQRNLAALKNCSDRYSKLITAVAAFVYAWTMRLTVEFADAI